MIDNDLNRSQLSTCQDSSAVVMSVKMLPDGIIRNKLRAKEFEWEADWYTISEMSPWELDPRNNRILVGKYKKSETCL